MESGPKSGDGSGAQLPKNKSQNDQRAGVELLGSRRITTRSARQN